MPRRAGSSSYRGYWIKFFDPSGWRGKHIETGKFTPWFPIKRELFEHIDKEIDGG